MLHTVADSMFAIIYCNLNYIIRHLRWCSKMATKRKAAAPAVVSLWSCASGAAIIECDVETVLELKAALQQDIVVADAHGTIIPSGCGLPVSWKDEPILVFLLPSWIGFCPTASCPLVGQDLAELPDLANVRLRSKSSSGSAWVIVL